MKKISWNHVFVALTFFVCIGVICWSAVRIDTAVTVSNPAPENDFTIVLDAGHGGIDGGCSTADGKTEKVINLNILLSVRDLGRFFGYNVEATRERDMSIHDKGVTGIRNQKISDMENRLAIFNKYGNSVCVSIHQNTFGDPQYSGAQMFYSDKNPSSELLASIMKDKFTENLQPDNQRETKLCGSELYLCYFCENPSVMVECGFLSNPEEAAKLTDKGYQQQVAFTIFSGINEFVQTNA